MNFVYFGFAVAISLLCHVQCENVTLSEFEERAAIVNGYNAPNRPFYVMIRVNTRGQSWVTCGGTIISLIMFCLLHTVLQMVINLFWYYWVTLQIPITRK